MSPCHSFPEMNRQINVFVCVGVCAGVSVCVMLKDGERDCVYESERKREVQIKMCGQTS